MFESRVRCPPPTSSVRSPADLGSAESAYATLVASTSTPPTFLAFLTSRYSTDAPRALLDRVRLKAALFLSGSTKYDVQAAKQELEEMEVRGLRGLTLERAIVYGKVRPPVFGDDEALTP